MKKKIYILLGTNLGDRQANLSTAKTQILQKIGPILTESKIYETAAWGLTDQPNFLNQVIEIETKLSPSVLLKTILAIEKKMGRIRTQKWGERLIDIDILYYGKEVINQENLKIPHPYLQERRFTLVPLAQVAPEFKHPVLLKSNIELLEICTDNSNVILIPA